MTLKDDFESSLIKWSKAPIASAYGNDEITHAHSKSSRVISEEELTHKIQEAVRRLEKDQSLFCGDPKGIFTYDDPILAVGAYCFIEAKKYASLIANAGGDGQELQDSNFWKWARVGIRAVLSHKDRSYNELAAMIPTNSITLDKQIVRIAVVGDAGYQCQAQANVIHEISLKHRDNPFDLLIHLGDIYFAGSGKEMLVNFLGPFNTIGPRVFTIPGNHDLYFGAEAFIEAINVLRQPGRFFCIETPNWKILGLDTSLPSQKIFRNEGRLDRKQLQWLNDLLIKKDDKKAILMSHHYVVSGWEKVSVGLKRQLKNYLMGDSQVFAWYWGHEHSCATYEKDKLGFYGACVGNGAFLEKYKTPTQQIKPSWYANKRCSCYEDKTNFWPHGYLELELQPEKLVEQYHLENGESHTRILLTNPA